MAKKGGAQQLQAEINTDEDFDKFLDRWANALIVLDIFSEWCGPCLGVVNALRKIKMELGGERLQLALCKSDYLTRLIRFRKKSEPTWLFVRDHRSVNLIFGSNVPVLMKTIKDELALVDVAMSKRDAIEIEDLHPEEQKRERVKLEARQALESKERYEREKKRHDYLMHCTNAILENLPDCGVSLFGTHVNRDMFKKLNEPAEGLSMQCKDRRFQTISAEEFQTANFACGNPLPPDVMELIGENPILACFWKIADESGHSVPYVMNHYANELTKKVVEPPDEYNPEERVTPALIEPTKIKVEYEVEAHVECPPDEDDQPKESRISVKASPTEEELFGDEEDGEEEQESDPGQGGGMPAMDMPGLDIGLGSDVSADGEEEEEEVSEGPPPTKMCTRTVHMPAIWVPDNERSHAALIYVLFRTQTLPFLTPDPPPEPPHVVMAFDTYKKRDLVSLAERNRNEIPMYGFFTSDDAEEAKFIANSTQKYLQQTQSADDKLVVKVNKVTSHMMLTLATYGPTYVSPNPIVGKEEALKFFPPTYKTAEEERLEAIEAAKAQKGEEGGDKEAVAAEEVPEMEDEMLAMEGEMGEGPENLQGEGGEPGAGAEAEAGEGGEPGEMEEMGEGADPVETGEAAAQEGAEE